MPAYIEVYEVSKPTCGQKDCERAESPEHHVRVEIGPAILGPVAAMLRALERIKGIEAEDWTCECDLYEGDEEKCIACTTEAAIKNGGKMLKAIKGRAL